jgi:glycosyltransferase involved in cell wall biosynthesis
LTLQELRDSQLGALQEIERQPAKGGAVTRPRLLHLSGYAIRGGCETSCATVIANSPGFSHDVVVYDEPGPMSEVWTGLGASVSHLDVLKAGYPKFLLSLRRVFQAKEYAGVLVWSGIRAPLVLALSTLARCHVVLYGGNPFQSDPRRDRLLRGCELLPRPPVTTLVPCSEHVKRSFEKAPYYRRLAFHVCLNPIPLPARNEYLARPLDPSMPVRLGMVARLDPIKDHATVLRAFALVRETWRHAELHLAGDGSERRSLENLARDLGITNSVTFLGSIGNVPDFLRSLDLFVYGTTESEGMGSALAEAVCYGLPSVVTDLPVMREVVGDESFARLARPRDAGAFAAAMLELLAEQPLRARLSQASYERAKRVFDARSISADYLRLLGLAPT